MESENTSCCNSQETAVLKKAHTFKSGLMSFLSTALIIVLPKCPFCVAAYSGAILMFFDVENEALIPFFLHGKPVLGVVIIALIFFNFNTKKSKIALSISIFALILLLLSTYGNIRLVPDWIIYIGFLFAVWYNGNFRYFYNFLKTSKLAKALKH
ncbi:hypothetical protein JM83_2158 [Gillisia sp. Hel_I_86]|uniref:hypothetical protein n=1 Tax=Gillisia sp. Hel_I_86 TaxID=1249981 RepID=UPI001199E637|nr:hypothetical protein [Gillisia sp. Hel_I_86]TVZ27135.1 hypothetical protein JM83_2158 [Gillisia sp. Hel_I_86]